MTTTRNQQIGWKGTSTTGVVAAGSAESVAAGIKILDEGGNAADAAVATIFALNVTDHGACSIGGEVPLLIYDARQKEVKALSGQGACPVITRSHRLVHEAWNPRRGRHQDGPCPLGCRLVHYHTPAIWHTVAERCRGIHTCSPRCGNGILAPETRRHLSQNG